MPFPTNSRLLLLLCVVGGVSVNATELQFLDENTAEGKIDGVVSIVDPPLPQLLNDLTQNIKYYFVPAINETSALTSYAAYGSVWSFSDSLSLRISGNVPEDALYLALVLRNEKTQQFTTVAATVLLRDKYPIVDDVQPSSGSVDGNDVITITGKYFGFANDSKSVIDVKIGGYQCYDIVKVSPEQLTCSTPFLTDDEVGLKPVVVTVDSRQGSVTGTFTYNASVLNYITPAEVIAGSSRQISVFGEHLLRLQNLTGPRCEFALSGRFVPVSFDTSTTSGSVANCTDTQVVSDTELQCLAPALTAGSYELRCIWENDAIVLYGHINELELIYFEPFSIVSVTPEYGVVDGGTSLTVEGTGFAGSSESTVYCRFNYTEITKATAHSQTTVTCPTPPWSVPGQVAVQVSINGATSDLDFTDAATFFTYLENPNFLSISPSTATTAEETLATVRAWMPLTPEATLLNVLGTSTSFRFGTPLSVSDPPELYEQWNYAGHRVPYTLEWSSTEILSLSTDLTLSSEGGVNYLEFKVFSRPHVAGDVTLYFAWDNQVFVSTGLTFRFTCDGYTTHTTCIADVGCGWCSFSSNDGTTDEGVCLPVDTREPSNYFAALQASTQTRLSDHAAESCIFGFGWDVPVNVDLSNKFERFHEMLVVGAPRSYKLLMGSSYTRARVFVSANATAAYQPDMEAAFNLVDPTKIDLSYVCGSLCPYVEPLVNLTLVSPQSPYGSPLLPSLTLTLNTSSTLSFDFDFDTSKFATFAPPTALTLMCSPSSGVTLSYSVVFPSPFSHLPKSAIAHSLSPSTTYQVSISGTTALGLESTADIGQFSTSELAPPTANAIVCSGFGGGLSPCAVGETVERTRSIVNEQCTFAAHGQSLTALTVVVIAPDDSTQEIKVGKPEIANEWIVTGLAPNTTYTIHLVATNSNGTSTGPNTTFTTVGMFTKLAVFSNNVELLSGSVSTDFGSVAVGADPALAVFMLQNQGTEDLLINDLTISNPSFSQYGTHLSKLAPNSVTYVDIQFSPLVEGVTSANVTVTFEDTETFTFQVTGTGVAPNSDSSLASLSVVEAFTSELQVNSAALEISQFASISLSPSFSATHYNYTAEVGGTSSYLLFKPFATAADSSVKVTFNGVETLFANISVGGDNQAEITVTAADGSSSLYTILVNRLAFTQLLSLAIYPLSTLSPEFSPSQTVYSVSCPLSVGNVSLSASAATSFETVRVYSNGVLLAQAEGSLQLVTIPVGNTDTLIQITSGSGSTQGMYNVTLTRPASLSSSTDLLSLVATRGTISPAFSNSVDSYVLSFPISVAPTLQLSPAFGAEQVYANSTVQLFSSGVASDGATAQHTIAVNASITVSPIQIVVISEDGAHTRTLLVTLDTSVVAATNASLVGLEVFSNRPIALSPSFSPAQLTYDVSVDNSISFVTITFSPADDTATVTSSNQGTEIVDNSFGLYLPLEVTELKLTVTAADGATSSVYIIQITRQGYTTLTDASTGLHLARLNSELSLFWDKDQAANSTQFSDFARSRSSPYTLLLNADAGTVECVDNNGCDILFLTIQGGNTHTFDASGVGGNNEVFTKRTLAVYTIQIIPELFLPSFRCRGRGRCPVVYNGDAQPSADFSQAILTTSYLESGSLTPQASSLWLASQLDLGNTFELRFTFQVSNPSLCVSPVIVMTTDDFGEHNNLDAPTGLDPVFLLSHASQQTVEGMLHPLELYDTALAYEALVVEPRGCSGTSKSRIGGEGFTMVIHNDADGLGAIGCPGTGLGFTSSSACNASVTNSVVIEFLTFFNVTEVQDSSRTASVNATRRVVFDRRNEIRVFEQLANTTKERTDPSVTYLIPSNVITFDDGVPHSIRVTFSPPEMCVFASSNAKRGDSDTSWSLLFCRAIASLSRGNVLNADGKAYVGFTAASGLSSQTIGISNLEYCSILGCGDRLNSIG